MSLKPHVHREDQREEIQRIRQQEKYAEGRRRRERERKQEWELRNLGRVSRREDE